MNFPNTLAECRSLLVGQTVRFTALIDKDYEFEAEENWMANITNVVEKNDCISITFDFGPFETHNDQYMTANYYDKMGTPCLTAKEVGYYEVVSSMYSEFNLEMPFEIITSVESRRRIALAKLTDDEKALLGLV